MAATRRIETGEWYWTKKGTRITLVPIDSQYYMGEDLTFNWKGEVHGDPGHYIILFTDEGQPAHEFSQYAIDWTRADNAWPGKFDIPKYITDEPIGQGERGDRLTKKDLLEEAISTVAGRGLNYGSPEDNFSRIARHWTVYLEQRTLETGDGALTIRPIDVATMMVLMKVARLENTSSHHDSWVDIAGYAACGGEIASLLDKTK